MKILNQRGYALLIVLFLIVFIMTVTTVFLSSSVSNAKQEKEVDVNHLSVVAAEMGIEYYKSKYENYFNKDKVGIWEKNYSEFSNKRKVILNNDKLSEKYKEEEIIEASNHYEENTAIEILSKLQYLNDFDRSRDTKKNEINFSSLKFLKDNTDGPYVSFRETNNGKKEYFIRVFGKVEGKYKSGRERQLTLDLIFWIPPMIDQNEKNNQMPSDLFDNPMTFLNPLPLNKCDSNFSKSPCLADKNTNILNAIGKTIYYDGHKGWNGAINKDFGGLSIYIEKKIENLMLKGSSNISIYSKEDFYLKQAESLTKSTIVTNSNLKTDKLYPLKESTVHVKGSLIFTNKIDIRNSSVFIGNDMKVEGNGNTDVIFDNSNVFITNNFSHPKGKTEINGKSLVCVGNNFIFDSKKNITIEKDSKLYITNMIENNSNVRTYLNDGRIEIVKPEELKDLCVGNSSEALTWSTTVEVGYD